MTRLCQLALSCFLVVAAPLIALDAGFIVLVIVLGVIVVLTWGSRHNEKNESQVENTITEKDQEN